MKLYRHKSLGGSVVVTTSPRYEVTEGYARSGGTTVATFSKNQEGQVALGVFIGGLASLIGASLYNEETGQYDVGTVGDLA